MRTQLAAVLALALLPLPAVRDRRAEDPPARVGRLNFITGAVSLRPGTVDDWGDATLNYPLTTGDQIWADDDSRAEIALGATALRLGPYTGIEFFTLDDSTTQIHLSEGSLQVRVRTLREGEVVEVDTPNGAVSLLRPGSYRVDADSAGETTTVTVRLGEAFVTAGGSGFSVRRLQTATLSDADQPTYDISPAVAPDRLDQWCDARDRRSDKALAARYVSRDMPGYEDLDEYGNWHATDAYGPVWTPRQIPGDWAPYRFGHWSWVEPWGWTWIDDASWGFAPFHYGRWVYLRGAWCWVPGRLVAVRPVYAPALVVFVRAGDGVGWFPLAPGEAYVPAYHASRTYVSNVNVTTVNVTNVDLTKLDPTRARYANRDAPRGVTVVGRETFVGARPIGREALDVTRERVAVIGAGPLIAPTRESVQPRRAEGSGQHPPEERFTRRAVVKTVPPPAPMPFMARERALQDHPGRPVDRATLDTLRARTPALERGRQVRPGGTVTPGAAPTLRRAPTQPRPAPPITPPREPENRPAPPPTPERRGEQPHAPPPHPEPRPPQPPAPTPPPDRGAAPASQSGGQPPEGRREPKQGKSGTEASKDTSAGDRRRP